MEFGFKGLGNMDDIIYDRSKKVNLTPLILNGREVANEVLKGARNEINLLKGQNKRLPGLAVILVGNNPASHTYVRNKEKICKEIGIYSEVYILEENITEKELLANVNLLNKSSKIDGILIQLPLPKHINSEKVIESIDPEKDIDGLHPYNLGKLLSGQSCLKPCTPQGVIQILKHYSINIKGSKAVVVGRSNLVGKPLALLLLKENATVTVVHSQTQKLSEITKEADILVCAIGRAHFIKKDCVKAGAVVIDVGINSINENGKNKITGDVDFEGVKSNCQAITPVPGGVGPVTIAMLMANTLNAYKMRNKE